MGKTPFFLVFDPLRSQLERTEVQPDNVRFKEVCVWCSGRPGYILVWTLIGKGGQEHGEFEIGRSIRVPDGGELFGTLFVGIAGIEDDEHMAVRVGNSVRDGTLTQ